MSQVFVEYIETVTTPCEDALPGCTMAWTSTPYSVSFWNLRSTDPQATVASRPSGKRSM